MTKSLHSIGANYTFTVYPPVFKAGEWLTAVLKISTPVIVAAVVPTLPESQESVRVGS